MTLPVSLWPEPNIARVYDYYPRVRLLAGGQGQLHGGPGGRGSPWPAHRCYLPLGSTITAGLLSAGSEVLSLARNRERAAQNCPIVRHEVARVE